MNFEAQRREVDANYDCFQRELAGLLPEHEGKYALMKGCRIYGFFEKPGEAYAAGHRDFADGIFSIQEVTDEPIDLGFFSHVGH